MKLKKVQYRLPPMSQQKEAMIAAWPRREFAWFMEMGTGKTYAAINLAATRFINGQILGMLVICPTPVKLVWELELEEYCPIPYDVYVLQAGKASQTKAIKWMAGTPPEGRMRVLVVGVEALSQGKAVDIAMGFANKHAVMTVVDESDLIKNPQSTRAKKAVRIGAISDYRLIMTGTEISQGMEDLYSQFEFLNDIIIGCKSFFQFKNMYCIMGGFENRNVIGYQRKEELLEKIAPYVYVKKLADCVDMPEKVPPRQLIVEPTKEQTRALEDLKNYFETEMGGEVLVTETILERMTRYQQICGGNFPHSDGEGGYNTKPIVGKNPKLIALLDDLDSNAKGKKVVIWARFRPEIGQISDALRERYGNDSVVEFHGGVSEDDRKANVLKFQDPNSKALFFVSNQATGGAGLTLTASHTTYYYSNDFSYRNRAQSEARTWRKGQKEHCTYTDIVMNVPYDKMIMAAVKGKKSMAEYVNGALRAGSAAVQKIL